MVRIFLLAIAAVVCVGMGVGCSGGPTPVSGEVTFDGNPMANVYVILTPTGSKGRPARGASDSTGKFSISTDSQNSGVFPGEYKVSFAIGQDSSAVTTSVGPDAAKIDAAERIRQAAEAAKEIERKRRAGIPDVLHSNYTRVDASPFTVTVPVKGPLKFNLNKNGTAN